MNSFSQSNDFTYHPGTKCSDNTNDETSNEIYKLGSKPIQSFNSFDVNHNRIHQPQLLSSKNSKQQQQAAQSCSLSVQPSGSNGRLNLSFTKCTFPADYLPYSRDKSRRSSGQQPLPTLSNMISSTSLNFLSNQNCSNNDKRYSDCAYDDYSSQACDNSFSETETITDVPFTSTVLGTLSTTAPTLVSNTPRDAYQTYSTSYATSNVDTSRDVHQKYSASYTTSNEDTPQFSSAVSAILYSRQASIQNRPTSDLIYSPTPPEISLLTSASGYGSNFFPKRTAVQQLQCCLAFAMFSTILIVLSLVVGFSFYLAIITNFWSRPQSIYAIGGSFKIISGDNFTMKLLNKTSTEFLNKSMRYETLLDRILDQSLIGESILSSEIHSFRSGSLIVFFRFYSLKSRMDSVLDMQSKAVINLGSIENVFIDEATMLERLNSILKTTFRQMRAQLRITQPDIFIDFETPKIKRVDLITRETYRDRLKTKWAFRRVSNQQMRRALMTTSNFIHLEREKLEKSDDEYSPNSIDFEIVRDKDFIEIEKDSEHDNLKNQQRPMNNNETNNKTTEIPTTTPFWAPFNEDSSKFDQTTMLLSMVVSTTASTIDDDVSIFTKKISTKDSLDEPLIFSSLNNDSSSIILTNHSSLLIPDENEEMSNEKITEITSSSPSLSTSQSPSTSISSSEAGAATTTPTIITTIISTTTTKTTTTVINKTMLNDTEEDQLFDNTLSSATPTVNETISNDIETTPTTTPFNSNQYQIEGFEFPPIKNLISLNNDTVANLTRISKKLIITGENLATTFTPPNVASTQCQDDEFECLSSGECVPLNDVCNQIMDCIDKSDEFGCKCVDYLYREENHRHKVCDGVIDCQDQSDELNCPKCNESESFVCTGKQNQCISNERVCDGEEDCSNGDDEQGCISLADPKSPNNLGVTFNQRGILLIRHHGNWGPLCFDNYELELNGVLRNQSDNKAPLAIEDMGQAVCRANSFDTLKSIDIETLPREWIDKTSLFYSINTTLANSRPKQPSSAMWSLLFKRSSCSRKKVARIECTNFECGLRPVIPKLRRRIVGGQSSSFGSWPWQAALYREGEFQCGAVIIDNEWVLTAAHCFHTSKDAYWTLRAGLHRRGSLLQSYHEELRRIDQIVIHPDYVDKGFLNDIALLRLDKPLQFSKFIRTICLPDSGDVVERWHSQLCTTVGWGKLYEHGRIFPDTLQEVRLPIISSEECRKRTLFLPLYKITENMFCAGYERGGRDACLGDSGGPMMCQREDGKWLLLGITSNGDGCGRAGRPGVYTKVSNYLKWIANMTTSDWTPITPAKCNGHRCPLGKCLSTEQICDHIINCEDSSDELQC